MDNTIVNAMPQSLSYGAQDLSGNSLAPQPVNIPTHLPKFYTYAQMGPVNTPLLVVGDSRTQIFGANSFDLRQPWGNHATLFSNAANAAGNTQVQQRIFPADGNAPASMRWYLDLLPTMVQDYVRNSDGSYKTNSEGAPVPLASKTAGYLGKWVSVPVLWEITTEVTTGVTGVGAGPTTVTTTTYGTAPYGGAQTTYTVGSGAEQVTTVTSYADQFGLGTQIAGDQTDTTVTPSIQSVRYPIFDVRVSSPGAWGNNQGLSLWAPTTESPASLVNSALVANQAVYPYFLSCQARPNTLTSPSVVTTLTGSQSLEFVFQENVIDATTNQLLSLDQTFLPAYNNTSTPGMPPQYGPFGELKVYSSEIATALGLLYAAEYPVDSTVVSGSLLYPATWTDFTGAAGEQGLFNFVSGVSSTNVPYHTFQIVTGASNSLSLNQNSTIYAKGGSDGTMSDALFDGLVQQQLLQYANPESSLMDLATNPESAFYDSGFTLSTKQAMAALISLRKDITVFAGTYIADGQVMTNDQELSIASSLVTYFQQYPESTQFATPAMRALVVGGSGNPINSQFNGRVPLTYEILCKAAPYMGAANGKWVSGKAFDVTPANQIDNMINVSLPFRPYNARVVDWAAGMMWAESYSIDRLYFPAFKTIYNNDSSVLNSLVTVLAEAQLQKVGASIQRDFSGVTNLTNDQLSTNIVKFVNDKVKDVFDGRFVVIPKVTFTADDSLRGYSWTTIIQIYSNTMKTVQTLIVQSLNMSQLPASSGSTGQ